ncbi:Hypothetical predicted protein [Olea europaea subsp. europaea]|uniref:Uncharacterized protein n=1 Tax=Olea europaea subsp. europaea TaxID=158383 RepID=A0A8S0PDJ4_OLEEU|nr:Hypothetical predicted protein [Olea europaea subsp. europaea]
MDPVDEIEYPYFPLTSSFDLGAASTPIISNVVDAVIAGTVRDSGIEKQVDVATKTINEDQAVLHIPLHTFMGHKLLSHLTYLTRKCGTARRSPFIFTRDIITCLCT